MEQAGEDARLAGRERPRAHLGVRGRGQVDPPDGRLAVQPLAGGDGREPVRVRLQRLEEALHPPAGAPAVLVGRRPGAELLAVVAHHADPPAVLRRVVTQVADDVLDGPERDAVAQALLRPEHGQQVALVLGGVGTPQVRLRDRGGPEVLVVEDRPAVAGRHEGGRQVGLPDALREPGAQRPPPRDALQRGRHARQLVDAVLLRERRQDRLVEAAAKELHLVTGHERAEPGEELGPLRGEPLQERAGVVERQPDTRVALERLEHRAVRALVDLREHPAEVANRLVIVDREGQRDPGSQGCGPLCDGTPGAPGLAQSAAAGGS